MASTSLSTREWAECLVGRDWEIYWDDGDEDNDGRETTTSPMQVDKDTVAEQRQEHNPEEGETNDASSEGSIIDDWYAGRILSAFPNDDEGTVLVRVLFVGDEHIYEMELGPSKVRPSARGWIKRTIALLCRKGDLPPDTATPEDRRHIEAMKEERNTRQYEDISFPDCQEGIPVPSLEDITEILELRSRLSAQIYLRSKLAPIVNLHGSIKYVAGEPNPTEPLVNHLVDCCNDVNQVCEWYLHCWELLTTCFGQRSGQSSNERESHHERSISYHKVLNDYLDFGKNVILNCATMDVESTTSKRRCLASSSGKRRPKRRRKTNFRMATGGDQSIDAVADEGDFRCTTFVDQFVQKLQESSRRWYLLIFAKMMQTISHYIVDPLVRWKFQANQLLGRKDDLKDVIDSTGTTKDNRISSSQPSDSKDFLESPGDSDDVTVGSNESEQGQFYTYKDVETCLKTLEGNPVLSLLDVAEEQQALEQKLSVIDEMGRKARTWLERLSDEAPASSQQDTISHDEVLEGLSGILNNLASSKHHAFNIDPLGKEGSFVMRGSLQGAVEIRQWLLDVRHALQVRERKAFIEKLVQQMEELQDLTVFPNYVDLEHLSVQRTTAEKDIREMHSILSSLAETEHIYAEQLEERDQPNSPLLSKDGTSKALEELGKLPVLLPVEEKIALRFDLMLWREDTARALSNESSTLTFMQVEKLFESLQSILKGKSRSASKVHTGLKANEKVENQLKGFLAKDAQIIEPLLTDRVTTLYTVSLQWKERAEAIISSLRYHGNASVGEAEQNMKPTSMVDIRRVNDLTLEYDKLGVDMPGYTSILQNVLDDASSWYAALDKNLSNDSLSCEDYLSLVKKASQSRPKGLIMDPTRQVIDSLVDLLEWHQETKRKLAALSDAVNECHCAFTETSFSDRITRDIYPLLGEGSAILEAFSEEVDAGYSANSDATVLHLENNFGIRRSARAPLPEKLVVHPFGKKLLLLLVTTHFDLMEGSPLAKLLWFDWHLSISAFLSSVDDEEKKDKSRSLSEAQDLLSREPYGIYCTKSPVEIFSKSISAETVRLRQLIKEGEDAESKIHELLSASKDLRKGCMEKQNAVRQHLAELKESCSKLKGSYDGKGTLSLDQSLEPQLDYHIRTFTWLVRTFSYPFLYLDEASYSNSNDESRIPWDVLISLFERLPSESEIPIDDFALVSLRVRELHEAAKNWQDEITRTTLLSNRGGKRRGNGIATTKGEHDMDATAMLQLEQVKQLAANPILSKVAMPREGAVNGILRSSTEFETRLHDFLGRDYAGDNPDRATFPDSRSLVGTRGEFILFRLTGGELFESVLQSMNELSLVAGDVLAETPGKVTFDWIKQAVTWIEDLNDKVTKESPFQYVSKKILVVPEKDARRLIESGVQLFLELPDDLKKTLSQHGIFVSTNRQEKSLRVVVKKDGAHNSLGATVIRWCPILFDALKADTIREESWQMQLKNMFAEFNSFYKGVKDNKEKSKKEDLYKWYCFRERVSALMDEGARSLVVSPKPSLVSSFRGLLKSIDDFRAKHSNPEFEKEFVKRWFAEGTSLLDDRFVLLESLLYRKSMAVDGSGCRPSTTEGTRTFRDACRGYLFKSFNRAAQSIGMANLAIELGPSQLQSFCCTKAWEVENEMFDRFQDDLGTSRVSEEYRRKARSLRTSLDDKNNLSLCLRVLVGDIAVANLVKMSSEQLASQKAKRDWERAQKQARTTSNLTPEIEVTVKKEETVEGVTDEPPTSKATGSPTQPASILRRSKAISSSRQNRSLGPATKADGANLPPETTADASSSDMETSPRSEKHMLESIADMSAAALKRFSAPRAVRPPPPPSLLNAFKSTGESESEDDSEKGSLVRNDSGRDAFRFETNPRLNFTANLYLEDRTAGGIDRFLPGTLMEKGRLQERELVRFVSEKLTGGRWRAVALRIVPVSQQDNRIYTDYYRKYEAKDRIAMMSVSQDTKAFLVSPKFHHVAKHSGVTSLASRARSYLIVLTKKDL